ncbi:MAG: glycosyltransferase [Solobacterium sp.]|nr:glycosyltransferase [Solobacterium sp.]
MKKILIFIESLVGGGAEKALVNLVRALDKKKYDITVMTVTDGDIYQEAIAAECKYQSFLSAKDYHAGGLKKLLFWLNIKYIYNAPAEDVYRKYIHEKYDVEIAFIEGFATKLIAASNNSISKKIAWVHIDVLKNGYADKSYKDLNVQIDSYRKYSEIICVSDTVKESFTEKYGMNDNVTVIHNILDYSDIKDKSNETTDIAKTVTPQFIAVGRLEAQKGYPRLLKCMNELSHEGCEYAFWIVGEGSQKQDLQKYILDNHLEDKVQLLGFQSNPYKYLKQADAFVCSSYAEGYSTAAIESLLMNTPVLTVECSGMHELLDGHAYGEIVPNDDQSLKTMLEQAILHPEKLAYYRTEIEKETNKSRLLGDLAAVERMLDE